jgi:hypothetical protein
MEHGTTSARSSNQIEGPTSGQLLPVGWQGLLVETQRECRPGPAIEAEHRTGAWIGAGLIEELPIDRHLPETRQGVGGDPAHRSPV